MKYLLLFSLSMFILINSNAQKQDLVINNDSIYSSLLPRHIEYLTKDPYRTKYLNDKFIYVYTNFPLNKKVEIDSDIWKVERISITKIKKILKNRESFYAIEYRPMYFNDGKIVIKMYDVIVKVWAGEISMAICGSTTFILAYDCENSKYKLVDEYNK